MRHAEKACGCRDVSPYLSRMQQKNETVTENSIEANGLFSEFVLSMIYDSDVLVELIGFVSCSANIPSVAK